MKNSQIQMFLVHSAAQNQHKILFKLFQNNLDIFVINTKNNQRFFKTTLNKDSLNAEMGVYFDTIKDMFDFFKQQKHQSIVFKPDVVQDQLSQVSQHFIHYQIPIGLKVMKKKFQLNQHKTSENLYDTTKMEIQYLQKADVVKSRVEEKKKRVKQLNQQVNKIVASSKTKDQQIQIAKKDISQIKAQIQQKLQSTQQIRKQFIDKNQQRYRKYQREVLKIASNQQFAASAGIDSGLAQSPSMILEAMPESYELNPMGKHVIMHNEKRNLFLKQKQITDSQIQSMIGFEWSPIQVLSFGGNKLTNKTCELLQDISDWQNVRELYLFGNPITNITKIKFFKQLTKIAFYDMKLDEASCDFLIKTQFLKLKECYLDFDPAVRQACWKKIVASKLANCPVLQDLQVDNPDTISQQTKDKLIEVCKEKNVQCKFGNPNASLENCVIY